MKFIGIKIILFRCSGLVLLETYSSLDVAELEKGLPPFLRDVVNVTGKPEYSMFNLSLRDESYDAKFYKYAAHGNKQQQPLSSLMSSSSSPLKNGYTQTSPRSNGPLDRPLSCSLSSASQSPVLSPTSDDVLIALTSNALKWANGQGGSGSVAPAAAAATAPAKSSSNGFHSSNGSSCSSSSNGGARNGENGINKSCNGVESKNGHAHLD